MPATPVASDIHIALTVPAAADAAGCCRHRIYRAILDGDLSHFLVGGSLRVTGADIVTWLSGLP